MRDICTTVKQKAAINDIWFQFFVYEVELRKLRQPFFQSHYYLYLFACGEGEICMDGKTYPVCPGTLVLVHPWQMFHIRETRQRLTYLYISFTGDGVEPVLRDIGAEAPVAVFPGHEGLLDFWMKSIRRVREKNALYITESVFAYTISYLCGSAAEENSFEAVTSYIQENLSNPELSVRSVAEIFFYSEKYFSYLFQEKTGVRFTDYLNELRIHHALRLMDEGVRSVGILSEACGFASPCYFSKVFKKVMKRAPAVYRRERALEKDAQK